MDPNTTWRSLAEAVQADDWAKAEEHANDLHVWINRGGFAPTITGQPAFDRLVAINTCVSILTWDIA